MNEYLGKAAEWLVLAVTGLLGFAWKQNRVQHAKAEDRITKLEKESVGSDAITEIKSLIKDAASDAKDRDKTLHTRISDMDKSHTARLDMYTADTNAQLLAIARGRGD